MTFIPPSISNYNASPPSDDGSQTTSNKILWSRIKDKLGDPVKNYVDALNSATASAFDGLFLNTISTKSVNFTVATIDDGKLFNCTSAVTATLPPAASAGEGFHIMVYNNSSGTITVDGDGTETINGALTYTFATQYSSVILVCTGSAWFACSLNIDNILPSQTGNTGKLLGTNGSVASWVYGTPTGAVIPYAGSTEPGGWLFCYGQAVSRTTYAALFAITSTTYGVGDGSTTFNLPDLRGRVVAGQDDMGGSSANRLTGLSGGVDGDVLGGTGGLETHTLTTAELASHTHEQRGGTATGGGMRYETTNSSTGITNSGIQTNSAGSGNAHNNVQPTIILNYIIKV